MNNRGSKFHPSRISGHQKFLRAKTANEEIEKLKKKQLPIIHQIKLGKSDWHKQNNK